MVLSPFLPHSVAFNVNVYAFVSPSLSMPIVLLILDEKKKLIENGCVWPFAYFSVEHNGMLNRHRRT